MNLIFKKTPEEISKIMNYEFTNNKIVFTQNDKINILDYNYNDYLLKESSYYLQEYFTSVAISNSLKLSSCFIK
jgi:hypothetical protein